MNDTAMILVAVIQASVVTAAMLYGILWLRRSWLLLGQDTRTAFSIEFMVYGIWCLMAAVVGYSVSVSRSMGVRDDDPDRIVTWAVVAAITASLVIPFQLWRFVRRRRRSLAVHQEAAADT